LKNKYRNRFKKKKEKNTFFKGLCTHYVVPKVLPTIIELISKLKIRRYLSISKNELKPEIRHSACSAASIMFPATRMDMVRVGIIQYGLWPSPSICQFFEYKKSKIDPLQRVIAWKSKIMSVKNVKLRVYRVWN
jgi:alanine racemase